MTTEELAQAAFNLWRAGKDGVPEWSALSEMERAGFIRSVKSKAPDKASTAFEACVDVVLQFCPPRDVLIIEQLDKDVFDSKQGHILAPEEAFTPTSESEPEPEPVPEPAPKPVREKKPTKLSAKKRK